MINLIIGPMFSGKTTELIYQINHNSNVLGIKYKYDTRYGQNVIMTHDKMKTNNIDIISIEHTKEIKKELKTLNKTLNDYDLIAIDEGQFITNLPKWVDYWADNGKKFVITMLSGDFKKHMFPNLEEILPKSDNIIFKTGVCACGEIGSFTKNIIPLNKVENIGGSELYEIMCRKCYAKK